MPQPAKPTTAVKAKAASNGLCNHIDDPLRYDHNLLDSTSPNGAHDIVELERCSFNISLRGIARNPQFIPSFSVHLYRNYHGILGPKPGIRGRPRLFGQ